MTEPMISNTSRTANARSRCTIPGGPDRRSGAGRVEAAQPSIETIEEIVRNAGLMKSRKVRILLAAHPCAPRRVALRLIREFYTFDLMQFALRPGTPADLRRFADELLISRVASITLGECISLARRSSEMVAGALLLHQETAVWQAALQNPRLTERAIIKALKPNRRDAGLC